MISLRAWLKSFGFTNNPFETTEAGSEANYSTDFLHVTFVKPDGFDEILGHPLHPKSNLVFAARGKGKSSVRLMTAHFCREGIFAKEDFKGEDELTRVLPVHHTRFERLIEAATSSMALVEAHVTEILNRAIPALVKMLIKYPDLAERVKKMEPLRRLELQSFLVFHQAHVPFHDYKFARDIFGREIIHNDEVHDAIGFSLPGDANYKVGMSAKEIKQRLLEYTQTSPIDQLGRFAALLDDLGIPVVYVLVDCLDEIPETADNFVVAAGLLIPLIANLNLMNNTPHLAFKVFAPAEMTALILEATDKVRPDRLAIQEIKLSDADLTEILKNRLAYCSNDVVSSMDAVCLQDLRGQMEMEMASRARGNPRHLVLLGRFMLEHRCRLADPKGDQETYLLSRDDLSWAEEKLQKQRQDTPIVVLAEKNDTAPQAESPSQPHSVSRPDDWLRHELPAPLARAYLAYIRERLPHVQIWKLYDLVEACTAYLSLSVIALLYQRVGKLTPRRLKDSNINMGRTSIGKWRYILEKLPGGVCASMRIRHPIVLGAQSLSDQFGDFILEVNEQRNRTAHDGVPSKADCVKIISHLDIPLHKFLSRVNAISQELYLIKVENMLKEKDVFVHHCTWYQGDTLTFPHKKLSLNVGLDSEQLWLAGDKLEPVRIHPLMIATRELKGQPEKVWLYQTVENGEVSYKCFGTGRTLDIERYRRDVGLILGV